MTKKIEGPLRVKDLIKLLQDEDQDRIVVMSKDGEGNGYSPFSGLSTAAYVADSTWSGEIGLEKLTEADKKAGYSEEDVKHGGEKAIVLWPTN